MLKRLILLTTVLLLLVSAAPTALTGSDCDAGEPHYARAVQLHDMGDYDRALRHYRCALAQEPDSAIIPILIENLHRDIAEAAAAWSASGHIAADSACDPALDYARLGLEAHDRARFREAEIHLHCALLDDPTDTVSLSLMGQIHINRGDTHTAQHYFDRAHALQASGGAAASSDPMERGGPASFVMPEWLRPYEMAPSQRIGAGPRTIIALSQYARPPMDVVKPVDADDAATEAANAPGAAESSAGAQADHTVLDALDKARGAARQAMRLGDRESALEWSRRAAAQAGANADDYAYLAAMYSMRGDMAGAADALSSALNLDPARLDLRCRLGMVYESRGDYGAAYAEFETVISLDVSNVCANENKRALSRKMNSAVSQAAAASPADATFETAMRYYQARKLYTAGNTLMQALAIDPEHKAARCQLGRIFTEWANYGGALAQFETVLEAEPQNACAREGRRLATLDMLAMYPPLTVDDFFYRARAYAGLEEWELARDAFLQGLALNPHRIDVRCELGMIYVELGDARAALSEFDRVLAQHVVDGCAWSNRDALMQRLRGE